MTVRWLLWASAQRFDGQPVQVRQPFSRHIFTLGARWMFGQWPLGGPPPAGGFAEHTRFGWYGSLKYGSSLLAALVVASALARLPLLLWVPLAGLAFYLVEVHLLFLFPLLLDGVAHPLRSSVRATYRVGLLRALGWTLGIAAFMLVGLLDWRRPWRKWHIGCLAVIYWYQDEIRAGVLREF